MKLLLCRICSDVIAPWPAVREPRQCRCRRHSVWWENPQVGIIRVYDHLGRKNEADILGIVNMLLASPSDTTAESVRHILDNIGPNYIFSRVKSPIAKFRPGSTSDSDWADSLPDAPGPR